MYNCDPTDCWDDDILTGNCAQSVAAGQCKSDTAEMMVRCKKSCNFCSGPTDATSTITPSSVMNITTSSTISTDAFSSTESLVHSSTQKATSRGSTVPSTNEPSSELDCNIRPDGNYADPINSCSGSFFTCSNGRSYRMVPKNFI
jgi:hypothetical protein